MSSSLLLSDALRAVCANQILTQTEDTCDIDVLSVTSLYLERRTRVQQALAQLDVAQLDAAQKLQDLNIQSHVVDSVFHDGSNVSDVQVARRAVLDALAELRRAAALFAPSNQSQDVDDAFDVDELADMALCAKDENDWRSRFESSLEKHRILVADIKLSLCMNRDTNDCISATPTSPTLFATSKASVPSIMSGESTDTDGIKDEVDLDDVEQLASDGISFMDKSLHLGDGASTAIWQEATLDSIIADEQAWDLDDLMNVVDKSVSHPSDSSADGAETQEQVLILESGVE